eukprot:comp21962_c0_seq4/m.50184 comp21962_c0_seq4/g.50184  ORF comp21962_c0_seq4/g.50184 comp21962_c0_seq4/m.50184 type:complete len:812 (-) comp21962_c0_seq4:116-2551(-)
MQPPQSFQEEIGILKQVFGRHFMMRNGHQADIVVRPHMRETSFPGGLVLLADIPRDYPLAPVKLKFEDLDGIPQQELKPLSEFLIGVAMQNVGRFHLHIVAFACRDAVVSILTELGRNPYSLYWKNMRVAPNVDPRNPRMPLMAQLPVDKRPGKWKRTKTFDADMSFSSAYSDEDKEIDKKDEPIAHYRKGGYHPVQIDDRYHEYVMKAKLGWGRFSTVWLALDESTNNHVAIKVQKANSCEDAIDELRIVKRIADFDREAKYGVVRLVDYFTHVGPYGVHVFLVYELLGPNLLDYIQHIHPPPLKHELSSPLDISRMRVGLIQHIIRTCLVALNFLQKGVRMVHTDIKPENIVFAWSMKMAKLSHVADQLLHRNGAGDAKPPAASDAAAKPAIVSSPSKTRTAVPQKNKPFITEDLLDEKRKEYHVTYKVPERGSRSPAAGSKKSQQNNGSANGKKSNNNSPQKQQPAVGGSGNVTPSRNGNANSSFKSNSSVASPANTSTMSNNNTTMNNTTTTTEGGDDGDGYYTYDSDDESSHTPRDITKAEEFQLPVPDGDLGLPHALPATELPQPGFDSPAARLSLAYTNFSVKIVDLGNCHPISQPSRSEIQTHQYRAPEVILGLPYNESADTFSMACVFFEILTGDYLFDSEDGIGFNEDEDHLMMMEQIAGPIPDAMKKGKRGHKFFNPDGSWKRIREPAARWTMDRYLQDKYGLPRALAEAFSSFVTPMLAIDPAQRLTPEAALRHPFMDEKTFDLSDVKEEDLFWEFDEGDDYGYDEPPIDKRGRPKVISERDNKGRKKKPGLIRQREHA